MKMIDKIINSVCKTDSLPIVGGATGAFTQTPKLFPYFPTWETVISTIVVAAIGAVVGYLIKLVLDRIFHKRQTDI